MLQINCVFFVYQRPRQPSKLPNSGWGREQETSMTQQQATSGSTSSGQSDLNEWSSVLANASPQQQKQMLGERLFPLVQKRQVNSWHAPLRTPKATCVCLVDWQWTIMIHDHTNFIDSISCGLSRSLTLQAKSQACFWRWIIMSFFFYWTLKMHWHLKSKKQSMCFSSTSKLEMLFPVNELSENDKVFFFWLWKHAPWIC